MEVEQASTHSSLKFPEGATGCRLWIDGVGCWLLWFADEFCIGNATESSDDASRIRMLANLRTQHARFLRKSGSHWLIPSGRMRRGNVEVVEETSLRQDDAFQLGDDVQLRYRVPSPLSATAVLTIESGHRTIDGIDGIVWFQQTCLIGPGEQSHIRSPRWERTVLLYSQNGQLWCRGQPGGDPQAVPPEGLVAGDEWRMRFEFV